MEFPDSFCVIVRPNASRTTIVSYDPKSATYRIAVAAKPEDNKANIELLRFLRKESGREVRIVRGKTSKRKEIRLER